MRKLLIALNLIIMLTLSVKGYEVEQVIWGFNGKVIANSINPVSILISNPQPEAFENALIMEKLWFGGKPVGAKLVKPVFIGPYAKKWVQFYPYIKDGMEDFRLYSAIKMGTAYKLAKAKVGVPATVQLVRPDSFFVPGKIQVFPDNLFPSCAAATMGLNGVIIDHNPDFSPIQKEAFLDWIKQGGVVYLIISRNGDYPQFSGALSLLNFSQKQMQYGAGKVIKLDQKPTDLTYDTLKQAGYMAPTIEKGNAMNGFYSSVDDTFFKRLKILVRTDHNWLVIFALATIYLLLVGPVNYVIARKRRNYKWVILFFLGTVLIFSLLFSYIGQRGYGEKTVINNLTYAHNLGGDNFDVTQWMNVFVTSGDIYNITHAGNHNYYSTCQDDQQIKGQIQNGKDGAFNVDIPLFSSIKVLHKGKGKVTPCQLKITSFKESGNQLVELDMECDSVPGNTKNIYALYKNRIYSLGWLDNKITLSKGNKGTNFNSFVKAEFEHSINIDYDRKNHSREDIYNSLIPLLIARSQGGVPCFGEYLFQPQKRRLIQVFIVSETPEQLFCKSDQFNLEKGYTVFHYDLVNKN